MSLRAGLATALLAMLIGASPADVRAAPVHAGTPATPLVLAPRVMSPAVTPPTCNAEINGDSVTDFASADASALRSAVAAVAAGGTVKVAGTCTGAIAQGGSTQVVLITKTLTLTGGYTVTNWITSNPSANTTRLDAMLGGRVINATQPVTISNLVVQNGKTTASGGGAFFGSSATLNNGRFENNQSNGSGGGLFAQSTLALTGTQFISNTALIGGGGLFAQSTLALTGTQFISNTAQYGGGVFADGTAALNGGLFQNNTSTSVALGGGGGLYAQSTLVLTSTQFISNTALFGGGVSAFGAVTLNGGLFQNNTSTGSDDSDGGGGLYAGSTLALTGTQFLGNTTNGSGGGVRVEGAATLNGGLFQNNKSLSFTRGGGGLYAQSTLALTGTQFLGNTAARDGGGAYAFGAATLTGGHFENNISSNTGGGLYAGSTLALTGTQFHNNQSFVGGGVLAAGAATLHGGLFKDNYSFGSSGTSGGAGGGGMVAVSTLALTGTQFISNRATINGGGVSVYGSATLNGGRFENNISDRIGGGGMYANSTLALSGTTFISNTAPIGGGLYQIASPAPSRIVNSLFARNRAGTGDAMYLLDSFGAGGMVDVIHTTVASPTLSAGTAIVAEAGTVNITNTIIANHTAGISQTGVAIVNENYTLFSGNTTNKLGAVNSGPNSFTGNPAFFDAASDNYRLTFASAANDVAVNAGVASDLDGSPRPTFGGFDIGAYEFQGPNNAPTANAGLAQIVLVDSAVTLNGGGSFDPDNHALTFAWTQVSGATVLLSSSTAVAPFFTAPASGGPLVFRLIVTDQFGLPSAPSDVTITVNNNAPVAEAGPAQTVKASAPAALDGLGSFDPEDQSITFAWTQVSGPAVTMSSNSAAEPAFTAPAVTSPATLVFQLVVMDAGGLSSTPSQVEITVMPNQVAVPIAVR